MNTPLRIFLCSTFTDLTEERKSVLGAIRRLQLQHDSMEFFGARTKLPIKTCLEEVRKSDVLVILVGHRYGNLVPRREISFSEAEYREGHRLKKPCLVYFRDESVPILPRNIERDSTKMLLLDKWKEKLGKRHTVSSFANASDLAVQVAADLSRTLRTLSIGEHEKVRTSRQEVSSAVAHTEQLREAMKDLERSYDITLEALGDALDLKDAETEGHSKRVTAYTIAIARAMGISGEKIRIIARGAFLHDIGKMAIPDAILHKPGPLIGSEIEIMRKHSVRGYQMLRKIPFLSDAAEIVHAHQERFDGSGYPHALTGDRIPIGARIFAIADTLDAITTDRPYRSARSIQAARAEIDSLSGQQFDPKIVGVFNSMPESIWDDLRTEIDRQVDHFSYPMRGTSKSASASLLAAQRSGAKQDPCPYCGRSDSKSH
jgi:putative nucleotidyltransferase with HDIG domain